MSPLAARAALVSVLAAAALGCERTYDPNPAASYAQVGVYPTAVGERLTFRIEPRDAYGGSIAYADHPVIGATCDVPGCTAELSQYDENEVVVASPAAGDLHVTVTVNDDASVKIPVTVSFRKPTKIFILREPADSLAGTAFGMVPGDSQRWWIGVADDAGPLFVPAGAITAPRAESGSGLSPVLCSEASLLDTSGATEPTTPIMCALSSAVPTTLDLHFAYHDLTRDEHVRVVPLAHVQKAEIVTCQGQEVAKSSDGESWTVPVLVPAEAAPPCTAADVVHYPASEAASFRIAARLVLDDGTVAVGGTELLALSTGGSVAAPRAPSGTVFGRFGDAFVSVPFVTGP